MKHCIRYIILLSIALWSCSSINGPSVINYPKPGTFLGIWSQVGIPTSPDSCSAIIIEADTIVNAMITNDSTKEILFIRGIFQIHVDDYNYSSHYWRIVFDSSNYYGKIDKNVDLSGNNTGIIFEISGNSFTYQTTRDSLELKITCYRKDSL